MKRKRTRQAILRVTEGVLSKSTDAALAFLFFNLEYAFGFNPTSRGAWRAFERAEDDLEVLNYQTIKRALYQLRSRGLISTLNTEGRLRVKITDVGKRKLEAILPFYDEERIWDEKLYLVTYDIAEKKRGDRDVLREYLRKIGCGMLQKSVWLTVYDPSEVLREFVESRGLTASVLVSCLGKGGNVGRESIKDVVAKVFNLDRLNQRYEGYINKYAGKRNLTASGKSAAVFDYLAILREDPQTPFELLPFDWEGEKAYKLFKKIST